MEDFPNKHSTQATTTVSETERFLSKLSHGYKRTKAQQILRLLKDQESLNKRFKDCALNEDDSDDIDDTSSIVGESPETEIPGHGEVQTSKQSRELQHSGSRKVLHNVDPSRCRTSMGFYNEAECSENVDRTKEEIIDFEAETDAALLEEREALLGPMIGNSRLVNQGGRRLFRLQLDENEPIAEEAVVQSARSSRPKTGIAASTIKGKQYRRPMQQTDIHNNNNNNKGNNRSNKYRSNVAHSKNPTISTSVSKLEGPLTTPRGTVRAFCDNPTMPTGEYACLVSTPRSTSFQPLTPRYTEVNGNFTPRQEEQHSYPCKSSDRWRERQSLSSTCEALRACEIKSPRATDPSHSNPFPHDLALCLTHHRNNDASGALTPRQKEWNSMHTPRQNELSLTSPRQRNPQHSIHKLYNQRTPREDVSQNMKSPRMEESATIITPRTQNRKHGSLKTMNKESSLSHQGVKRVTIVEKANDSTTEVISSNHNDRRLAIGVRMPTTPRSIITVDQSPLQTIQGVAENGEVLTPRRQNKPESSSINKSKNLSSLQRSGIHHNLSKLSDRVHPITMMKLPPLEVTINKPVIS